MNKAPHLTPRQLSQYQARTLGTAELVEADGHIAACDTCRAALFGDAEISGLGGLRHLLTEHLEYDEIAACAEGKSSSVNKLHLQECPECRAEVADLRGFRGD